MKSPLPLWLGCWVLITPTSAGLVYVDGKRAGTRELPAMGLVAVPWTPSRAAVHVRRPALSFRWSHRQGRSQRSRADRDAHETNSGPRGGLQTLVQTAFKTGGFVAVFESFANGAVNLADCAPIVLLGLFGVLSIQRLKEGFDTRAHRRALRHVSGASEYGLSGAFSGL